MSVGELIAGRLINTLTLGGVASAAIAVASQGTAYGLSFPIARGVTYMFTIKLAGSGVQNVKVELEMGSVRPTAESAADTTNYCVPDNKPPIFGAIADTNLHKNAYAPVADGYARLKYTGGAGNDASTTVAIAQVTVIRNT